MLSVYLAATIVGSILLVASLVGGHHGHDAGHDHGHGADHHGPGWTLLSLRLWTYVLTFGGATGLLLRLTGETGAVWTGVLAGTVGLTAGIMASVMFAKAASTDSPGTVSRQGLVGRPGRVIVAVGPGVTGKVRVGAQGGDVDLLATTEERKTLEHGEAIVIVGFAQDIALVVNLDDTAHPERSRGTSSSVAAG